MDIRFLPIFISFFLFSSLKLVPAIIITSCSKTPYPKTCDYYVENNFLATLKLDQTQLSFHNLILEVTLDQSVKAHEHISSMNLSSFNKLAKLAWTDCLELYEDTIDNLNRSMSSSNPVDSVTWLSAAIANQQTCENGFTDFNLGHYLESLPLMLTNFSQLVSNSLAVTQSTVQSDTTVKVGGRRLLVDEFPSWLSAADRKLLQSAPPKGDIVVAQDGTGEYKTISEAVAAAAKRGGGRRMVIYVKKGIYRENVEIKRTVKNIMLVGDGIDATIVTASRNANGGTTTFRSATFAVTGEGFIAKGMTFENTAGPENHQAVALRSGSDFSVFYGCSFKGYQDTLYVYAKRQFYRNCDVYGTQDFIFGDAVVVLQNCNIYIRKSNQKNTVTAQGRKDPNENTGIIIHNSRITGVGSSENYLGRPWKQYSRTVIMKCTIDSLINPAGWLPWSGSFALNTLYYGEYMNTGGGASTSGRVKWPGYHVITSPTEAGKFTVGSFLAGNSWLPATGVPYDAGL